MPQDPSRAPVTLYQIGLLFTLRHWNLVRATEQKSLHFVGDTKSNPVCAVPGNAKCKQEIWYALVQYANTFGAKVCIHYNCTSKMVALKKMFLFALTAASMLQIMACLYSLTVQYYTIRRHLQKMIIWKNGKKNFIRASKHLMCCAAKSVPTFHEK